MRTRDIFNARNKNRNPFAAPKMAQPISRRRQLRLSMTAGTPVCRSIQCSGFPQPTPQPLRPKA
jgi:hypothetical protein